MLSLQVSSNRAISAAASAVVNVVKSKLRNRDETRYAKEAAEVDSELRELKEKRELTEDEKVHKANLVKKAKNIKGHKY